MYTQTSTIFVVKANVIHYSMFHSVATRNPLSELRPVFVDILLELMQPDFKLLTWAPEDEAAYSEQARTLGAPLEAGEELYNDIQNKFNESISSSTI